MSEHAPRHEADYVTVSIYDQTYHLRGHSPQSIERLAALVDDRMRAVAACGATVDSLRVAVLAALNIADELEQMRARAEAVSGTEQSQRSRAHSLAGLLDAVIDEKRRAG